MGINEQKFEKVGYMLLCFPCVFFLPCVIDFDMAYVSSLQQQKLTNSPFCKVLLPTKQPWSQCAWGLEHCFVLHCPLTTSHSAGTWQTLWRSWFAVTRSWLLSPAHNPLCSRKEVFNPSLHTSQRSGACKLNLQCRCVLFKHPTCALAQRLFDVLYFWKWWWILGDLCLCQKDFHWNISRLRSMGCGFAAIFAALYCDIDIIT